MIKKGAKLNILFAIYNTYKSVRFIVTDNKSQMQLCTIEYNYVLGFSIVAYMSSILFIVRGGKVDVYNKLSIL